MTRQQVLDALDRLSSEHKIALALLIRLLRWQAAAGTDPHTPEDVAAVVEDLAALRDDFGGMAEALAAYQLGTAVVQELLEQHGRGAWRRHLPQGTREFVQAVMP